ncbi:hypothetical protein DPMN_188574 [Dreissena polymorpha]|uniref:Uncharacterized protein n=1 Tax=Dreissena polymorpha TaxID=45954 RepID=A0A9D4DR50_DREPO|nr:hypothetical protein DPMN_188574 [Dreissena polymorpha]
MYRHIAHNIHQYNDKNFTKYNDYINKFCNYFNNYNNFICSIFSAQISVPQI